MSKFINPSISRLPTYEIFARFAPGALEPIQALRKQYGSNQVYPRDLGIRLFKDIYKSNQSSTDLQSKLSSLANRVAPFEAPVLRAFRNSSSTTKNYPPSVYYQVSKVPLTYLASQIAYLVKNLHKRDYRSSVTSSFKLGVTGHLKDHDEALKVLDELNSIEAPEPIKFDAFVLATRANTVPQSELEDEVVEFPFKAKKEDFEIFWKEIQRKRLEHYKKINKDTYHTAESSAESSAESQELEEEPVSIQT